ncbi:MAG: FadR/GntR family transcriptional regulator [bacterium]|nr:FadR/GntR family transcriptional regulator [bacterium]
MLERQGLPRGSVSDAVADRILADISSGEYRPGDRLPTEPELARQLGVGRTSVREGVGKLRLLGAVEVRRGLGTFVTEQDRSDARTEFIRWTAEHRYEIVDIFEVRMSLETTAASLAATRASPAELEQLSELAEAHGAASDATDLALLVKTDQAFHEALLACSHNEALQRVYSIIVPELVPYRTTSLALSGASDRSAHDHRSIVSAIRSGQPIAAQSATLAHLSTLYDEILRARDGAALANEEASSLADA